jgi:hypothetical protein
MVKKAQTLSIKPGTEQITSSEFKSDIKTSSEVSYEALSMQYPPETDSDDERTRKSQNFMSDNKIEINPEAREAINTQMNELNKALNGLKAQNPTMKVLYCSIYAYAATSCVRTKYKSKIFDKGNNVQLANDRCEKILEFGTNGAQQRIKLAKNVVAPQPAVTNPNIGPEWQKMGGIGVDGKTEITIDQYGELYKAAYAKYNKLTPQQFYGMRDNNAAAYANKLLGRNDITADMMLQEYNAVYGPYRISSMYIEIGVEMTEEGQKWGESVEYEAAYTNKYGASISWKASLIRRIKNKLKDIEWPSIKIKSLGGRRRPRRTPNYAKMCQVCCPKW